MTEKFALISQRISVSTLGISSQNWMCVKNTLVCVVCVRSFRGETNNTLNPHNSFRFIYILLCRGRRSPAPFYFSSFNVSCIITKRIIITFLLHSVCKKKLSLSIFQLQRQLLINKNNYNNYKFFIYDACKVENRNRRYAPSAHTQKRERVNRGRK